MTKFLDGIDRPNEEDILRAKSFSSATLHEAAGKKGALPSGIKPLAANMKVCGPAITVHSPPIDNIMLHEGILAAKPGDVLVVEVSGIYEAGYWGDIMTKAAQVRGIQGLIIDGCVRDSQDIIDMNFPVFSRGLCIQGTGKAGGGTINQPINIGNVTVSAGDLIVGDRDGIVVLPKGNVADILMEAQKRDDDEKRITEQLGKGETTMEIYGWESTSV
ncbi:4-carboxy-4-hydroxy-2-oxoadipate aldolase/oxaloacetate decarboxylase [Alkalihalobacillus deserti]|uniref:4-carboxy-4-hydroxy-2-oxoadipate aldolase/oxaloacetate decarboxylase n=1 Tax=Alkalihalobacillus deserti TaxID=2879466 RepID=UPI001D153089|nr:4-carboxy-4-hydroxy-2-oxoadipate aldolase/oxaloacetate decarboxylase [Alkalihalobacillus deserti]